MTLYEDLNIDPAADAEAIKRAYRRRAAVTHPDREGGSAETFHAVQLAYEVLSDPERRERYDRTGQTSSVKKQGAESLFRTLMDKLIADTEFAGDYIARAKSETKDAITMMRNSGKQFERDIARFERLLGRIKVKAGGNLFEEIVIGKLKSARANAEHIAAQIDGLQELMLLLEHYSDTAPVVAVRDPFAWEGDLARVKFNTWSKP